MSMDADVQIYGYPEYWTKYSTAHPDSIGSTRRTVRKIDSLPLPPTQSAHQTQTMTAEVLRGFPGGAMMDTRTERWIGPVVAMHHLVETGTEQVTEWVATPFIYII